MSDFGGALLFVSGGLYSMDLPGAPCSAFLAHPVRPSGVQTCTSAGGSKLSKLLYQERALGAPCPLRLAPWSVPGAATLVGFPGTRCSCPFPGFFVLFWSGVAAKSFVLPRWPNLFISRPPKVFRGTKHWPAPPFPAEPNSSSRRCSPSYSRRPDQIWRDARS